MLEGPKNFDGLIEQLQDKSRQNPDDSQLMLRLARLYLRNNDSKSAAEIFARILKQDRQNSSLMVELAHCCIRENKLDDAHYYLENAISISPGSFSVFFAFARLYEAQGNAGRQVHYMMLAANSVPEKIEVRLALAELLRKHGDFNGATEQYRRVLDIKPNIEAALFPLSSLMIKKNNLSEAIRLLRTLLSVNPGAFDAHFNLANCYMKQKKYSFAVSHLRISTRKVALRKKAMYLLSQCFMLLKDYDQAIVTIEKLIESDERNVLFHQSLAEVYETVGDHDLARDTYYRLCCLDPKKPEFLSAFALSCIRLNDLERAEKILVRLFQLSPGHIEGHLMMAELNFRRGDSAAAIEEYRRVLMIKEDCFEALSGLAKVFAETGNTQEEYRALVRLSDNKQESPELLMRLGEIERKLKLPASIDRFKRIREIAPQSDLAIEAEYYLKHIAA